MTAVKPSTGRPPTPPSSDGRHFDGKTNVALPLPNESSSRLIGKSMSAFKVGNVSMAQNSGKLKAKANTSILSFFKKAGVSPNGNEATKEQDMSLFIEDAIPAADIDDLTQTPTPPRDNEYMNDQDLSRFNEDFVPSKKRRLLEDMTGKTLSESSEQFNTSRVGPFVDGSDDEENAVEIDSLGFLNSPTCSKIRAEEEELDSQLDQQEKEPDRSNSIPDPAILQSVPTLKREPTSRAEDSDFEGIADFIDDEFPEDGEEYMERKWMERQGDIELGLDNDDDLDIVANSAIENGMQENQEAPVRDESTKSCPICSGSLDGINEQEASKHVNDCLDGKATPLPMKNEHKSEVQSIRKPLIKTEVSNPKRFSRATIARPGQENPFNLASGNALGSTAFSQLMKGHAEDAAWAAAAATESASRGKPAYQRTCPFYKILPGFFICVDAFRYGAVEGCQAYFLSHFHSDHYIGLTSSWCHGPIYCSRVTGNLVRRQLRVDPKWVFDLEFDRKIEVPGTQGVDVTMIPANHCPGSSLFLYEKVIGRGKNPKVQRVLHCGDFRACPAHVQHPLLRPDVVDRVTGKNIAKQKLDVCYLDTTYLTPKYAFPSQEQVIKACADMCVSLSKDRIDESDDWEQTKKERAGTGMVKFVRKDSDLIKGEGEGVASKEVVASTATKSRGRLLVIVGTYSIGKERICLGVAKALNSKIYAPPNKQKICAALEDPELSARMTNDPLEAQVHMQMLMEIRAETLADYLTGFKPHFSRIVGFRPSGWNYRPPNSRFTDSPAVQTVLHSGNWKSYYSMAELVPQRGSTREANCFGVPYSEHSSFRELTMFCCALRIDKIIPTVNVGSAKSREKMKAWCEKWAMDKKKNGLFKVIDGQTTW